MKFEEHGRDALHAYAHLATTVAAILTAAINVERDKYRLQQVKARAKHPASLRRKLDQRGLAETTALEAEIKDLAGCRTIFYTNRDVSRFINSGIISQNFEVLDMKIHHPHRDVEDATELYTSNHYLVALNPERLALPEYAGFAGMRCEIQIQTILHHAWAEMGAQLDIQGARACKLRRQSVRGHQGADEKIRPEVSGSGWLRVSKESPAISSAFLMGRRSLMAMHARRLSHRRTTRCVLMRSRNFRRTSSPFMTTYKPPTRKLLHVCGLQ